jgi:hypothetical protein
VEIGEDDLTTPQPFAFEIERLYDQLASRKNLICVGDDFGTSCNIFFIADTGALSSSGFHYHIVTFGRERFDGRRN